TAALSRAKVCGSAGGVFAREGARRWRLCVEDGGSSGAIRNRAPTGKLGRRVRARSQVSRRGNEEVPWGILADVHARHIGFGRPKSVRVRLRRNDDRRRGRGAGELGGFFRRAPECE